MILELRGVQLVIANKNYSSWSLRPWILLTTLGIPFEERLVPFGTEGFAAVSPTGRVPCLVDGDLAIWDSLAIVEYLAEAWPAVWPAERRARAWARSAAAEMHSGFGHVRSTCPMSCGLRVEVRDWAPALLAEWARLDALFREGLDRHGGPWLAGPTFTAVDAFFAPVAFRAQSYAPPLSPTACAYLERLLALPGMRAWYAAALAEPWRDAGHEAEARAAGTWREDHRGAAAP